MQLYYHKFVHLSILIEAFFLKDIFSLYDMHKIIRDNLSTLPIDS